MCAALAVALVGCDGGRAEALARLRRSLAAAGKKLPPPSPEPWAANRDPVPMARAEVIKVLGTDLSLPPLSFAWPKGRSLDREKLRRWLRTDWLHRPDEERAGDPSKVRFALVYRPTMFHPPKHVSADENEGGEVAADVAVVSLSPPAVLCRAPVRAWNGRRLSFPTGGPAGLTPQEALEVDLRRALEERAHGALIALRPCRKLPPPY